MRQLGAPVEKKNGLPERLQQRYPLLSRYANYGVRTNELEEALIYVNAKYTTINTTV